MSPHDISTILNIILTVTTIIGGIVAQRQKSGKDNANYTSQILTAVSAAEKAIDKVAYSDDGTYQKAREDFAILVLSKLVPNFDDKAARADIEAALAVIHSHAQALESGAAAPSEAVTEVPKVVVGK